MKRLWILALVLLLCPCVQAQNYFELEDYEAWMVTFYELLPTVDISADTFMQGDIIEVSWRQPLTEPRPFNEQPDPTKFLNTGKFVHVNVLLQNAIFSAEDSVAYEADVNLSVGKWAIGVKAVLVEKNTDGSNIVSKQGGWYPIYIGSTTKLPPDVPVSINVRLRPGG